MNTFTIAETDSLTTIAMYSPCEGGLAVHFARAMLGLEVNDPKLVLRNAMPQLSLNQLLIDLNSDYKESNNVNEADKPLYIIIADLTGKQVARINPDELINNKITTEGIYFLTTKYASGKEINTKAFIYKK